MRVSVRKAFALVLSCNGFALLANEQGTTSYVSSSSFSSFQSAEHPVDNELGTIWPAVRDELREIHHNTSLREKAKAEHIDIVLLREVEFIDEVESPETHQLVRQPSSGDLVFNAEGIKLHTLDSSSHYLTPSCVKGLIKHHPYATLSPLSKRRIARELYHKDLLKMIDCTLEDRSITFPKLRPSESVDSYF
jgi:hypothetical protein